MLSMITSLINFGTYKLHKFHIKSQITYLKYKFKLWSVDTSQEDQFCIHTTPRHISNLVTY